MTIEKEKKNSTVRSLIINPTVDIWGPFYQFLDHVKSYAIWNCDEKGFMISSSTPQPHSVREKGKEACRIEYQTQGKLFAL